MHDAEKTIVEELNEWSDEQFGKWFVDGLRDWHGRTYSENSFGKARILLGWHPNGSVVDEIKSLFDKLSEGGRYAFSTGLGRAISEAAVTATFCEPERHQVDVSIVIDLLGLVGLVRAGRALRNGCQDLLSERSLWWRENRVVLRVLLCARACSSADTDEFMQVFERIGDRGLQTQIPAEHWLHVLLGMLQIKRERVIDVLERYSAAMVNALNALETGSFLQQMTRKQLISFVGDTLKSDGIKHLLTTCAYLESNRVESKRITLIQTL
jgi:hypothetical protein